MMKILVVCAAMLSWAEVSAFPNLGGVLLPTPVRFFIPQSLLGGSKNGNCKAEYPKDNKKCMIDTMTELMKKFGGTADQAGALLRSGASYGKSPMQSGYRAIGGRKGEQVLCYAATTACECALLKDFCKKKVTEEDLKRSDGKTCEPQGAPTNVVCR